MTIPFKRASFLIKKYNSGYKIKDTEIDEVIEWANDFKEQMLLEKKATLEKNKP